MSGSFKPDRTASKPAPTRSCPVCPVQVTAKDYLETALLPVPGTGDSVNAKNGIRASIKALFPDR